MHLQGRNYLVGGVLFLVKSPPWVPQNSGNPVQNQTLLQVNYPVIANPDQVSFRKSFGIISFHSRECAGSFQSLAHKKRGKHV